MSNVFSPVVLFVYNRPWHARKTVEALQKNDLAGQSELFIYSDNPRNEEAAKGVRQVRDYIREISGFKKVTIIERDRNWGLADSVVDGVTTVVNHHGRVIVLEDDIVTSPFFLRYMNDALEFYKDNEKVMHIAGYTYPINNTNVPNVYFLRVTSCWGWGTWSRAWRSFDRSIDKFIKIFNRDMIRDINFDDTYDYWSHLIMNKQGRIKTWAIFWYLSVYLKGGMALHPKTSFTNNIGHDGSGIHCSKSKVFSVKTAQSYNTTFTRDVSISPVAEQALKIFFRSVKESLWRRMTRRLRNTIFFAKNFMKRTTVY